MEATHHILSSALLFTVVTTAWSAFVTSDTLYRTPRYVWVATLPVHLVLYPSIVLASYLTHPYNSVLEWLFHEPSRSYDRLFLYLFIGHFIKDFYVSSLTKEYMAHHLLAIALAMRFLFWETHSTFFCVGAMVMELGSATQTILFLYPSRKTLVFHKWGMTASNTVAFVLECAFVWFNKNPLHQVIAALACALCAARQQYTMENIFIYSKWCKE
jgi:hypothetical protein